MVEREEMEDVVVEGQSCQGKDCGLEEDELTDNISDLLKGMNVSLNGTQMRGIREIIAGTLDERAQREEQVDDDLQANGTQEEEKKEGCGGQPVRADTCAASV